MSRVIGVICEYNPFHKGHKYQIDRIRELEDNAIIVAIMSGNIVQRGEFAIIDKYYRTRMALKCGVDAVFELPYPYSGSTAEIFANAGVELAYRLGCDAIYFGTEKSSIAEIENVAAAIDSPDFDESVRLEMANKSVSYILAKERALLNVGITLPKSANDMLGVEYVRAIKNKGLNLKYNAIQRMGSFYNDIGISEMMSASAIRRNFYASNSFMSVPFDVMEIYDDIVVNRDYLDVQFANKFLQSYILLNGGKLAKAFDTCAEISALIEAAAKNNLSFESNLSSKVYTTARLKRSILYALFDVENVDFTPKFTMLLGMNAKGQEHVNKIKKNSSIHIITKHSDGKRMSLFLKNQLERLYLVDGLYYTLLVNRQPSSNAFKNKPIVIK